MRRAATTFRCALALAALALCGCAGSRLGVAEPILDPSLLAGPSGAEIESAARERLVALYLPEAVITHRAIFSARGKDMDMNGRLALGGALGARLVGMLSIGNILFDVSVSAGGKGKTLRPTFGFKPAWIERHAARDVYALYLSTDRTDYTFGALADGRVTLWRRERDGEILRHHFDSKATSWIGAEIVRGDRLIWRARRGEGQVFTKANRALPETIHIESLFYTMSLTTLDLKEGAPNPRLFATGAEGAP